MYSYNILQNLFPCYIWEHILAIRKSLLVRRNFENLDLEFEPKWCFDYININGSNRSLAIRNLELQSPDFIQVPLLKKYLVRRVFSKEQVKFIKLEH